MFSLTSRVAAAVCDTLEQTVCAPVAACTRFLEISFVVMLCSSTAEAIVREASFTRVTTSAIRLTALMACPDEFWMPSTRWRMSLVASAVCRASSLTSVATTAKPLPASPARAASIVAFRARSFVCSAMSWMTSMTWPMPSAVWPRWLISWFVFCTSWAASSATRAACSALRATSLMAAVISSTLVATRFTFCDICVDDAAIVVMLTDISSAAAATVLDCWVVCSAPWRQRAGGLRQLPGGPAQILRARGDVVHHRAQAGRS